MAVLNGDRTLNRKRATTRIKDLLVNIFKIES